MRNNSKTPNESKLQDMMWNVLVYSKKINNIKKETIFKIKKTIN